MSNRYLNAQEAADELGISLPTLYAYVSRGLIRSEEGGDNKRARRYYSDDVQKLKARKESRRNPEKLTEGALHWGVPLMDSAISLIANGRVYYRGYDAAELAVTHSVEQVAALIWTDDFNAADTLFSTAMPVPPLADMWNRLTPIERFQALLPLAAHEDFTAYDLRPAAVAQTGARILQLLAAIAANLDDKTSGIVDTLQRGWLPDQPEAAPLLNAALILCADHELNVSSFAARVVASAGSTPYAVVSGGLAAMQGIKHGGHTERVEAFLNDIAVASNAADVRQTLAARLRRGEAISGFGHKLYPDGDPRAALLLRLTADTYPDSPAVALAQSISGEAFNLLGEHPTVDFALAMLARAAALGPGRALALFAIGRTIGWIGHATEQYAADSLIRPRARYVGRQPG